MDHGKQVIEFVRTIIDAEWMTPPGVVNLVGVFTTFLIVLAAGLGDLAQIIVRTWNDDYETGLPSIFWFIGIHLLVFVGCTLLMALLYGRWRQDS